MTFRRIAALSLLLAAAACGQKGPLYLPGDPNEGRILVPTTEEPPSEDDEEQAGPADDDEQ